MFLGHTGFRFPFSHWPTTEASATSLYTHFWKAVYWLLQGGFIVHYCYCDGGSANRSFVKLHFKDKDPCTEKFTTTVQYKSIHWRPTCVYTRPLCKFITLYALFQTKSLCILQSWIFISIVALDMHDISQQGLNYFVSLKSLW